MENNKNIRNNTFSGIKELYDNIITSTEGVKRIITNRIKPNSILMWVINLTFSKKLNKLKKRTQ